MAERDAKAGYLIWLNLSEQHQGTDGKTYDNALRLRTSGQKYDPLIVDEYGIAALSPESRFSARKNFIEYLSKSLDSKETIWNLQQNLYNLVKIEQGLDIKAHHDITNADLEALKNRFRAHARTDEDPVSRAGYAWALAALPEASRGMVFVHRTGPDSTDTKFADGNTDLKREAGNYLTQALQGLEKNEADRKAQVAKAAADAAAAAEWGPKFAIKETANYGADDNYAYYQRHIFNVSKNAPLAEVMEVHFSSGTNPLKIIYAINKDPSWEKKITAQRALADLKLDSVSEFSDRLLRMRDGKLDNPVTLDEIKATETLMRNRATLEGANPVEAGLYAAALRDFSITLREFRNADGTTAEYKKMIDDYLTEKESALKEEGGKLLDALIEAEKGRTTPSPIANTAPAALRTALARQAEAQKAAAAAAAAGTATTGTTQTPPAETAAATTGQGAATATATTTTPGEGAATTAATTTTPRTRNTVTSPDVLDIQSILNLTEKGTDPQWMDGVYDFRTNAAAGIYLKNYQAQHNIPGSLTDAYKANKNDGEMQGPVDAAWIMGFRKLLVEERLKKETDFRLHLLENAKRTLEREIPKVHPVGANPKRNHEIDDITSVYVLLNLLGNKDRDGQPFPTDNKTAAGQKATTDKDRMAHALAQLGTLITADNDAIRAKNDAAQTAEDDKLKLADEISEAERQRALAATAATPATPAAPAAPVVRPDHRPQIQVQNENLRWEKWREPRLSSDHFTDEKDRENLRNANVAAFNGSKLNTKQRELGIMHIDDKGRLVYMYEEGSLPGQHKGHIRALDITDERNKVHCLHNAMFSDEIVKQANEAFQRSVAAGLKEDGRFDTSVGIVKEIRETHRADSHYRLHIHDSNCDGVITRDEVHLVTREYEDAILKGDDSLKRGNPITRAWEQTPEDIRLESTTLKDTNSPAMLTTLGLTENYMDKYNRKAVFQGVAAGATNGAATNGAAPAPAAQTTQGTGSGGYHPPTVPARPAGTGGAGPPP